MNKKGSALAVVTVVSVAISIIVLTIYSINYSMYKRTLDGANKNEAYYTAYSGVNLFVKEIVNHFERRITAYDAANSTAPPTNPVPTFLDILKRDSSINIDDAGFSHDMGKCSIELTWISDDDTNIIKIKSEAEKNGEKYAMELDIEEVNDWDTWDSVGDAIGSGYFDIVASSGDIILDNEEVVEDTTITYSSYTFADTHKNNRYLILGDNDSGLFYADRFILDNTEPLYIYVSQNTTLNIASVEYAASDKNIYIILGNGAVVDFCKPEIPETPEPPDPTEPPEEEDDEEEDVDGTESDEDTYVFPFEDYVGTIYVFYNGGTDTGRVLLPSYDAIANPLGNLKIIDYGYPIAFYKLGNYRRAD